LFKLFLFIKAYFDLLQIKLITCELRITEGHTHLLFLVINTTTNRKKKKIQFIQKTSRSKSGLRLSSLIKPRHNRAINFIFFNLPRLKAQLGTCFMPFFKTKLTHF